MRIDIPRVAEFLRVVPCSDAAHAGKLVFRIPKRVGYVSLVINTTAAEVGIDVYGPSAEQLFTAWFNCDEVLVVDEPPPRKLPPRVMFFLAAAPVDYALFMITEPPGYEVSLTYVNLK